jgi:hypothetical protein
MSESTPETGTPAPPAPAETAPEPQQQEPPAEDYEAKWKAQQKVNRDLERKLEQTRTANMNETEKAVHEAEQRGRSAALQDFGQRLARTEFDALAARRNPDFNTGNVLEYVDLSKMVGEDGEPDAKALRAAVERLVPEPQESVAPEFGGGTRTPPSKSTSFGDVLRTEIQGRR